MSNASADPAFERPGMIDILNYIISGFMDPHSIAALSLCSRTMYSQTRKPAWWRNKFFSLRYEYFLPQITKRMINEGIIKDPQKLFRNIQYVSSDIVRLHPVDIVALSGESDIFHWFKSHYRKLLKQYISTRPKYVLIFAAMGNSVEILSYCFRKCGRNVLISCFPYGTKPLFYSALRADAADVIRFLLEHSNIQVPIVEYIRTINLFSQAISQSSLNSVRYFMDLGCEPDVDFLQKAIDSCSPAMIRLCLSNQMVLKLDEWSMGEIFEEGLRYAKMCGYFDSIELPLIDYQCMAHLRYQERMDSLLREFDDFMKAANQWVMWANFDGSRVSLSDINDFLSALAEKKSLLVQKCKDVNYNIYSIDLQQLTFEYTWFLNVLKALRMTSGVETDRIHPGYAIECVSQLRKSDPQGHFGLRKAASFLLFLVGSLLVAAGFLALLSGIGIFQGGFMAAAGSWLLSSVGISAGTALATGVSASVAVAGMSAVTYGVCRFFQSSPRQRIRSEVLRKNLSNADKRDRTFYNYIQSRLPCMA